MKSITQYPSFLLLILCSYFFIVNTIQSQAQTAEDVTATFGIRYEPIEDGRKFTGTLYLADRTPSLVAIGMNLETDSDTVRLHRESTADCKTLYESVVCNPRADDAGLDGYKVRWNWTAIADNFTTFPQDFIQLEFTCLTTGIVQPFTEAMTTDLYSEEYTMGTATVEFPTYDCPTIGTPNVDPTITPFPTSIPLPTLMPTATPPELPTNTPESPITPNNGVTATFGIRYEPIGDGSQFIGTLYLADRTPSLVAVGMNLETDSDTVLLHRDNTTDCKPLYVKVVCNPQADYAGLDGYKVRWNWTAAADNFVTFPQDFIQLEFTCLTTGIVQPITEAMTTDLYSEAFTLGTLQMEFPTYDCSTIDPAVPQQPEPTTVISNDDVTTTFGIRYEPVGDGRKFTGTVYLVDQISSIDAIGMDLQADLENVHVTRNEHSDCTILYNGVFCNPRADFGGVEEVQIHWNRPAIIDSFIALPQDFIQLEFTCLTTGVVQPITDAIIPDRWLKEGIKVMTFYMELPTYDCPSIEIPDIDPSVPQVPPIFEPTSTPVVATDEIPIIPQLSISTSTESDGNSIPTVLLTADGPESISQDFSFDVVDSAENKSDPTAITLTSAESPIATPSILILLLLPIGISTVAVYRSRK